jgi:hypothetical protein
VDRLQLRDLQYLITDGTQAKEHHETSHKYVPDSGR